MEAYKQKHIRTHQKITRVVDGDGLFVVDNFEKIETEIRLLGIDAPETKRCRKLLQDERETHMPGQLLMKLGNASKKFLSSIAPVGTYVTLVFEKREYCDVFGRALVFVLLCDGSSLNERMISEGFAKPYDKHYCEASHLYQAKNMEAKQAKRGLYNEVEWF